MNKLFKFFFFLLTIGSFILSSCSSEDGALAKKITIDGESVKLANGYIAAYGPDQDENGTPVSVYLIALTTSGLTINETTGDTQGAGDAFYVYLASPSTIELKNGTYTFVDVFEAGDPFNAGNVISIVYKGYDATDDSVDSGYYATDGTFKISKSGTTFKITFSATLIDDNGNEIKAKGSYEGKLVEFNAFSAA